MRNPFDLPINSCTPAENKMQKFFQHKVCCCCYSLFNKAKLKYNEIKIFMMPARCRIFSWLFHRRIFFPFHTMPCCTTNWDVFCCMFFLPGDPSRSSAGAFIASPTSSLQWKLSTWPSSPPAPASARPVSFTLCFECCHFWKQDLHSNRTPL